MKKIVFIDIQENEFYVKTLSQYLYKRSSAIKHRFYLDYLLSNPNYEVYNFITKKRNDDLLSKIGFKKMCDVEAIYKYNRCLKLNNLNSQIKIINDLNDLTKEDIIIYYVHYPYQFDYGQNSKALKAVCFTHLYGLKMEANLVKKVNPDFIFGEGKFNIYSSLFIKNFSWFNGSCIESLFVPNERFRNKVEFNKRKNKAFATGTVTKCNEKEFVDEYGNSCYQPLRKQLLDNFTILNDVIDSKISEFEEVKMKNTKSKNALKNLYSKIFNRLNYGKQKTYFSFDMVEMFNNYKICIVPEDINGVPGIGFVEGIFCGCAYIGSNKCDYSSYGLVDGESFIEYDGTIKDLRKKIQYYLNHEDELEIIAKNGYKILTSNLTYEKVAHILFKQLIRSDKK